MFDWQTDWLTDWRWHNAMMWYLMYVYAVSVTWENRERKCDISTNNYIYILMVYVFLWSMYKWNGDAKRNEIFKNLKKKVVIRYFYLRQAALSRTIYMCSTTNKNKELQRWICWRWRHVLLVGNRNLSSVDREGDGVSEWVLWEWCGWLTDWKSQTYVRTYMWYISYPLFVYM